jgi:Tol biopolymer transport system component
MVGIRFSKKPAEIVLLLMVVSVGVHAQTYRVKGKVSTSAGAVRYASVTFVDQHDTARKFPALSDTSGNYQLDIITSVQPHDNLATKFELEQNYPNPFYSSTAISYKLAEESNISVKIYNVLGQIVKEYRVGAQGTGVHGIIWDGTNESGAKVSSGVYIYQLLSGSKIQAKKMLFGFGSGNEGWPLNSAAEKLHKTSEREGCSTVQSNLYRVQVENNDRTKPKILFTEIPNVIVQRDTTLDFEVQLGIMAYSLCYQRWDSSTIDGHWYEDWDLYLNSVSGTNRRNITNSMYNNDYNPAWSPDGRYIAFRRDRGYWGGGSDLYLYDTVNDTSVGLIVSDSVDADTPIWTPDGKRIVYAYHVIPHPPETHMINVDGTNDRKIEHAPAFFYPDSYTFLYSDDSGKVYKTNIDNSFNEFASDLWSAVGAVRLWTFNPHTEEIQFTRNSNSLGTIESYSIPSKTIRVILTADSAYKLGGVTWSRDFSRLAFQEAKAGVVDSLHDEYLCVLENGYKRRLVRIALNETDGGSSSFSWYKPQFSPDGKYIAYDKLFAKKGQWAILLNDLFVVEVATGNTRHIDSGVDYNWNPLKPH